MKRCALYLRVSTLDQHPETQLYDLQQMAKQRGYEIVATYEDRISGAKARRPGLDQMLFDGKRGQFDVVMVWAFDRMARRRRIVLSAEKRVPNEVQLERELERNGSVDLCGVS